MVFTRTPRGLAEKWRFHDIPTIWVEGSTDIYFYVPVLDSIPCRLEAFHGIQNANSLIEGLVKHNYPYLVILDGDYNILRRTRSPHRNIVILSRYSFENYLWEKEPVNQACLRHARCGERIDIVSNEMDRVVQHLTQELLYPVVLDVAARNLPSPPQILPNHIEQLLHDYHKPDVDPVKVDELVASVEAHITPEIVREAETQVNRFLAERCFMHLLKGHIVFGVLYRVFLQAAKIMNNGNGGNLHITHDTLIQLLTEIVWRKCNSEDHRKLKRKIRSTTRKLLSYYPASTSPEGVTA